MYQTKNKFFLDINKLEIISQHEQYVGYIALFIYKGCQYPHLEYHIEEPYRNQGIMSKELPKYLKHILTKEKAIVAMCKQDNIASIKLLEKNEFIKIGSIEDKITFVISKLKIK